MPFDDEARQKSAQVRAENKTIEDVLAEEYDEMCEAGEPLTIEDMFAWHDAVNVSRGYAPQHPELAPLRRKMLAEMEAQAAKNPSAVPGETPHISMRSVRSRTS